jgi:hypothetical protein
LIALLFAAISLVEPPGNSAEAASEPLIATQLSNPDPDFLEPKSLPPARNLRLSPKSPTRSDKSSDRQADESWRCDAQDGGFAENEIPISGTTYAVTGQILFHNRDFTGSDIPSAHIAFTDSTTTPSGDHCFCKGVRAQIFPERPDIVTYYMVRNGKAVGMAESRLGIPITFKFMIDKAGVMTAAIGKTNPQILSAKLTNPRRDMVHMTCSSADVSFLNVRML